MDDTTSTTSRDRSTRRVSRWRATLVGGAAAASLTLTGALVVAGSDGQVSAGSGTSTSSTSGTDTATSSNGSTSSTSSLVSGSSGSSSHASSSGS